MTIDFIPDTSIKGLSLDAEELESVIEEFIGKTEKILRASNNEVFSEELQRIKEMEAQPQFSVAVVGEFSRGKSTLLNSLLDSEILPVGDIPTTAFVTRLSYGEKQAAYIAHGDGNREELTEDNSVWEELLKREEGERYTFIVECELPSDWLRQWKIQLIDTPGAGDLEPQKMEMAYKAIASSNATLIAVSSTMALSLTERKFVEDHVFGRKIPRAALVLTRMDLVKPEERGKVIEYVKNKLKEWGHDIPVLCAHGAPVIDKDVNLFAAGPEEIREIVVSWAKDEEMVYARKVQIGMQLIGLMRTFRDSQKLQIHAAKMSLEEKAKVLKAAEDDIRRGNLAWEDIKIQLDKRALDCSREIEIMLRDKRQSILTELRFDLEKTSNPKAWWEKELSFLMKRELNNASKEINNKLRNKMNSDAEWIYEHIENIFGCSSLKNFDIYNSPMVELTILDPVDMLGKKKMMDMGKFRLMTRIGFTATAAASYVIFGPLISAVNAAGVLASDLIVNKNIKEQKLILSKALEKFIDNIIDNASIEATDSLRKLYLRAADSIMEEQNLWIKAQRDAVVRNDGDNGIKKFEINIKQADEFIKQLSKFLKEDQYE